MYEIILTSEANKNLRQIKNYISEENPIIANKIIEKIFSTFGNISMFPNIGKELKGNIREFVEPNYKFRIIYRIKNSKIEIEIITIFKNKNFF